MKKTTLILVTVMTLLVAAVGCGQQTGSGQDQPGPSPKEISIGTSGTAGVWYPTGTAIGQVITKYTDVQATAEPSAGVYENLRNLREHRIGIAMLSSAAAHFAHKGLRDYSSDPVTDLRSLFSFENSSGLLMLTRDESGIKGIEDLRGKRIALGPPGGSGTEQALDILRFHGIEEGDIKPSYLSHVEAADALKNNTVDVACMQQLYNAAVVMDLAASVNLDLVSWDTTEFRAEYPWYEKLEIEAGKIPGVDHGVETSCISAGLYVLNEDFTRDEVYSMVKAIWEHSQEWTDVHAQIRGRKMEESLRGLTAPLHVGAYDYYKERGMTIPETLVPPEAD